MATLVLSAAGMALGGSLGGSVLGLSSAVLGRAAGAMVGRAIDQRLLGLGADPVETGRIDRLRLTGASEGTAIAQVYGRYRLAGQVIWATRFFETSQTSGGGKGTSSPRTTEYSYSVSLALALCEGEITRVGRIWADGTEIPATDLSMRVYSGTDDQLPDPRIEAVEGAGAAPAYRGTAYVVIEDLPLGPYGNRIPQFTFEVFRPSQPGAAEVDVARQIRAVALIPGTGEYALATTPLSIQTDLATWQSLNVHSPSGKTDFSTSLDSLTAEVPGLSSVSVIVSWFGNDLRCDECRVGPRVDNLGPDPVAMPWSVSGAERAEAGLVPMIEGQAIYGGTPTDASVIEALRDLSSRGIQAVFYPFLLMEQTAGNTLPNPWTATTGQDTLPWRGRITLDLAPGVDGTVDGTAAARAQVDAFFGTAQPGDFTRNGDQVIYSGPEEWSYRRFILHYAHLCAAAGGVGAFLIGSELRSLTQIRDDAGFPVVDHLCQLAAEVRAILGPEVAISYAADWSEYHGYQPAGTADKLFHLDPLWAHPDVDFIGIDNYMPLSDWRDGEDHLDRDWGSIYDMDYLRSNVAGGEMFDWYYHSDEARAAQIRTAITDDQGEPWIWRAKDIRGWWSNLHYNRVGGVRSASETAWVPGSKPVWFTEFGCAAIDKGTNQPNKFLDPKSSESGLPYFSNGNRDDLLQAQYLRAVVGYYSDPANNPQSEAYGGPMIDMSRAHVWAWDARPFPFFPGNVDLWDDGDNYARGHWLNGRVTSRTLGSVIAEICARAGLSDVDVSGVHGIVRGYTVQDADTARAALQPLMVAYGVDAVDRGGRLTFISRGQGAATPLDAGALVLLDGATTAVERKRAAIAEVVGRVRIGYVESDGDYEARTGEAIHADDQSPVVSTTDMPLVLTSGEAGQISERWLAEARQARETVQFALPPSMSHLGAGDMVQLGDATWRIDRLTQGDAAEVEAVSVEPSIYAAAPSRDDVVRLRNFIAPVPVRGLFLDLPLMDGSELPHAPHFAAVGVPWPGSVALWHSETDSDYTLSHLVQRGAVFGVTQSDLAPAEPGRLDRGLPLRIQLANGALSSVGMAGLLSGKNLLAIGDGSAEGWELIQVLTAELIGPNLWEVSGRLRGQYGTDHLARIGHAQGALVVVIDAAVSQISYGAGLRGVSRYYRFGPGARPMDDPTYQAVSVAANGVGLRPYPVCHLRSSARAGQTTRLSWVRRTRLAGDSWDAAEVPLNEDRESYRLRIRVDGTVKREVLTSDPALTYSQAQQIADGAGGGYEVEVAQLSATFGAGPGRVLGVPA